MQVALLARRRDRLDAATEEAGPGAVAIECDVTDQASVTAAIAKAAADLGGIDALVYTPAVGPLARLADTDAETWNNVFATNVTGASLVTSAAISHLTESHGRALYLSSVSASLTPPWPGLGAYAVSKAALDKMVEAWRVEHPDVGFTRCIVGDCTGGEGDSATEFPFASGWNFELMGELHPIWEARGLLAGCFIDVEDLVNAVDAVLRTGTSVATPSITLAPRPLHQETTSNE
jgi:NAD(P)-dependent dehydrogenase (short-subunit alcohol dehydrogenase family)